MIVKRLVQLANGTISIVVHLPIQAARTFDLLSPDDKARVIQAIRKRVGLGAFADDSVNKALPYIALGIVGIVGFNIWRSLRG